MALNSRGLANEIFPNIVPPDRLRLPDALTIKYGPARLLSRMVIEGDLAARRLGIRLRLRHDFDELVYHNRQQVAAGNMLNMPGAYNPENVELTPENGFWISGETDDGEIVLTDARRIHN